ncbi:hypothetical protein VN97_g3168 [Penicillium thymicola]|uniref:Uncharacterized protein n=1 Tax=Penicillium thymicola TaxID=293382 RepID=A0AAI9TNI6_PENTH|nr:hypothetical protein VN97_g3168 [Penicillium thymicola]
MTESLISKSLVFIGGYLTGINTFQKNEAIPTTEYTISVCTHFSALKLLPQTRSNGVFMRSGTVFNARASEKPVIYGMGIGSILRNRFNLQYTV